MANSKNPLPVGEELFVECEMGLDPEIVSYVRESHEYQIRIGGEPFYLWTRQDQGEYISKAVTTWTTTSPQYSTYIWQPSDGETAHPDARVQQNQFRVFDAGTLLTRVASPDLIAYDTEYSIEIEPGDSVNTRNKVRLWFNYDYVPTNVSYSYRNVCSCVDVTTGYPNRECAICRGTSYPAAFVQYTCASTKYLPENTVLVRIPMVAEMLSPEQIGRVIRRDTRLWMQSAPQVNNFDLLMGTIGQNAGVLFEIVSKSESRLRGIILHQEFQAIRIEESDVRYELAPVHVSQITTDIVTINSAATVQ